MSANRSDSVYAVMSQKREQRKLDRAIIQDQVSEFLRAGGKIKKLPGFSEAQPLAGAYNVDDPIH